MSEWKIIPTINDTPRNTRPVEPTYKGNFKSIMDKVPVYTGNEEEIKKKLKEHEEMTYAKQVAEETKLLDAFANKKLKSKSAIRKARSLAKRKNDAGKKVDKAAKPQDNIVTEG